MKEEKVGPKVADFGPLLGTSNSPARDAPENSKMFEFDLLYRLKRCELLLSVSTRLYTSIFIFSDASRAGETWGNIIFFGGYC